VVRDEGQVGCGSVCYERQLWGGRALLAREGEGVKVREEAKLSCSCEAAATEQTLVEKVSPALFGFSWLLAF